MPDRAGAWKTAGLGVGLPLLLALLVLSLDLVEGPEPDFFGVLVAPAFLAAALVGPAWTALTAAATAGIAFGFGFLQKNDTLTASAAFTSAQWTRLLFILVSGILAVVVATVRVQREARLARFMQISEVAQRAILPELPRRVGGLPCAGRYQSATSEAHVGGDLYEVLDTAYGVRALIGDARGKGIDAVRVAGYVLGCFRAVAWSEPDLARLARSLDSAVRRIGGPEDFVTAALVQLDGKDDARLVVCGHPPPLSIPPPPIAGGQSPAQPVTCDLPVTPLLASEPDPPLGLLHAPPRVHRCAIAPGDRILLITDGLAEARWRGRFLDVEGTVATAFRTTSLDTALDAILTTARRHVHGLVADDLALVAIQTAA
ncbi:MAG TPA: PP2C family protein-serine/threonine phosphatase [Actinomycetes bacterium]|nr:PP2C family protein-serine/threonine phosphatase [Actinomycetes bacterium]